MNVCCCSLFTSIHDIVLWERMKRFEWRRVTGLKKTLLWLSINMAPKWSHVTWCKFLQHFTRNFFTWKCFSKLFFSYSLALQFFGAKILAQKLLVKCWWNWLLGLISSTFYALLLRAHIPKAQKNTIKLSVFFCALGSACKKAVCKMLVKHPISSFFTRRFM